MLIRVLERPKRGVIDYCYVVVNVSRVFYDCSLSYSNIKYAIIHFFAQYINIYIYIYGVSFFLHNCPLLIPLHNTAVLIKICRF